jgi:hypothetical protein
VISFIFSSNGIFQCIE